MSLSLDNTKNAFAYKTNAELRRANFLFSIIQNSFVVSLATKFTPFLMKSGLPINGLIRSTIFNQFVGGETLEESARVTKQLGSYGVQVILDYGVEAKEGEDNFDNVTEKIIEAVEFAATQKNVPFVSVKLTGLASMLLLEKLNESLEKARKEWEEESSKNKQTVTEDNVAEVVSMMTGIPLQKVGEKENERLARMGSEISGKVVGQDEAVKKVVRAIQRGRVGMKDANKPVFSGMLIGNSGVGKTELAKQIAKYLFDSEDSLIRLDMSEYMDKISMSKIQGSAPGYVGYEDANVLDRIRRKPYSVVLFDEIEKAHPEVFNIFLQMLDDGHVTDSHGRKVSFKNCIILMTSNVGTRLIKDFGTGVGFSTKNKENVREEEIKGILEKELKNKFAPEFINRIDEIIYFRDLGKEEILKIVDLELVKTIKRASDIGYVTEITETLKDHLVEVGYDPKYGARPLKRAIQRWVDDIITDYIIENNPKEGTKFLMDYNKEEDKSFVVQEKPAKKARKKKDE